MRISTSNLDAFRYWLGSEESTDEQLVAELTHKVEPGLRMLAGRAYDEAILDERETASFMVEQMLVPIVPNIYIARGFKQIPFDIPVAGHRLVGKVDQIIGMTCYDDKLSNKFDPERYINAMQWRAYLLATECSRFVYRVSVLKGLEYVKPKPIVERYEELSLYPYPTLGEDVEEAVTRFADAVTRLGLAERFQNPKRFDRL